MAKMKFFGRAMAIVRNAPRKANGKIQNAQLTVNIREMLAKVRAKDYDGADIIAKDIVSNTRLHK